MVLKQIELKFREDSEFRATAFPESVFTSYGFEKKHIRARKRASWNLAVRIREVGRKQDETLAPNAGF